MTQAEQITYLGYLEQVLRHVNDTSQLLHVVNPILDSFRMTLPGRVQDALHLVDLALSPFTIHRPAVLENSPEDAQ